LPKMMPQDSSLPIGKQHPEFLRGSSWCVLNGWEKLMIFNINTTVTALLQSDVIHTG